MGKPCRSRRVGTVGTEASGERRDPQGDRKPEPVDTVECSRFLLGRGRKGWTSRLVVSTRDPKRAMGCVPSSTVSGRAASGPRRRGSTPGGRRSSRATRRDVGLSAIPRAGESPVAVTPPSPRPAARSSWRSARLSPRPAVSRFLALVTKNATPSTFGTVCAVPKE